MILSGTTLVTDPMDKKLGNPHLLNAVKWLKSDSLNVIIPGLFVSSAK